MARRYIDTCKKIVINQIAMALQFLCEDFPPHYRWIHMRWF